MAYSVRYKRAAAAEVEAAEGRSGDSKTQSLPYSAFNPTLFTSLP